MKMIKIENHYYVVNDDEIKEGEFVYHPEVSTIVNHNGCGDRYSKGYHVAQGVYKHKPTTNDWYKKERKIIYSTQPIEGVTLLNLSDVEEVVNGYSVDDMAESKFGKSLHHAGNRTSFKQGFKACQELMKDKLFTVNDMNDALIDFCNFLFAEMNYTTETEYTAEEQVDVYLEKYSEDWREDEWNIEIQKNKILIK